MHECKSCKQGSPRSDCPACGGEVRYLAECPACQGSGEIDDSGAAESDTSDDSSGAALPATGRDTGALALLGLMTLALGVWLRRRAAAAG